MSLAELLPEVRGLPREDKEALLRQLADELSADPLIPPGEYPVWPPWDAYGAAAAMQAMLDAETGRP